MKILYTQIDMFTSDYAEGSLSCTLAGLWMTEKGWIKGTVNHTACWAHSASNIQNQHIQGGFFDWSALKMIEWFWLLILPTQIYWLCDYHHCNIYNAFIRTIAIEWMDERSPLISMVLQWFLVSNTIGINGFPMDFGPKTIASNGFSMVFGHQNHW